MENENLETTTTEVEETAQTPTEEKQEKEKTFTQSEVDEMIEKRLSRERKKLERESKKVEDAKAEAEATDEVKALKETIKKQNERILRSEARETAKNMNVDADFIEAALALADFSGIDMENNGDFDADEITEALQAVIDKYPRFLAKTQEKETAPDAGFIKTGTPASTEAQKINDELLRGAFKLHK